MPAPATVVASQDGRYAALLRTPCQPSIHRLFLSLFAGYAVMTPSTMCLAGDAHRYNPLQRLLLAFIFVRTLTNAQLVDFVYHGVPGPQGREVYHKEDYDRIEWCFNTLNQLVQNANDVSAYEKHTEEIKQRRFLHENPPKKRHRKQLPVDVAHEEPAGVPQPAHVQANVQAHRERTEKALKDNALR